jgi:ankyrin repeat protein
VEFFVERFDAEVNVEDDHKQTPLQLAIRNGLPCKVQYLLRKRADVNHLDGIGQTPLLLAIKSKCSGAPDRKKIISLLIEYGADPNSVDREQNTPLTCAVLRSDIATVDQLLNSNTLKVKVEHLALQGRTALSLAAQRESIEIIKKLIPRADINSQDELGRTPLAWAVEQENYSVVRTLLEYDSNVDVDRSDHLGRTPFSLAAGRRRIDIMGLLLQHQAIPHIEDHENHSAFWWFLKRRAETSIHLRAFLGRPTPKVGHSDFQSLIQSLQTPNGQDTLGRTWLSWAAEYGDEPVVDEFLKNRKVNPNKKDDAKGDMNAFARTPLIRAAENNHNSLVYLMTTKRSDDTSLNYLMNNSQILGQEKALGIIKTLLRYGDDWITEITDRAGEIPIHIAVRNKNHEFVEALIAAKTSLYSTDHNNRIPLQIALYQRDESIVNRLLQSMVRLQPVQSVDWLQLGNKETHWVQVSEGTKDQGLRWNLIREFKRDMVLPMDQRRL